MYLYIDNRKLKNWIVLILHYVHKCLIVKMCLIIFLKCAVRSIWASFMVDRSKHKNLKPLSAHQQIAFRMGFLRWAALYYRHKDAKLELHVWPGDKPGP